MSDLMAYLPQFYRQSPEMAATQAHLQAVIDDLWRNRDDFAAQLCIDTATWGLTAWEEALGLRPDAGKDIGFRRDRVKAKLRGAGTTTKALIQRVAESFSNGAVEVLEYPREYRVVIKFAGRIGVPPNLDDLTQTLREIMPAHLQWEYEIVYNLWRDVAPLTWGQASAHTWGGIKEDSLS